MEAKILARLQTILDQRKMDVLSGVRFRIETYSPEDVREMLLMCYKSEVESRMMEFIPDEATNEKVVKTSKWLCSANRFGLLLYGSVGSGKTTLARSICTLINVLYGNAYNYEDRKGVVRVSALDLANRVSEDKSYLYDLKHKELLFIDDLGVEPETVKCWGNEISPITELLYSRYDNQLFTIATSNLAEEEFGERYGKRIYDRMEEMFDRLYYNNKSYRK